MLRLTSTGSVPANHFYICRHSSSCNSSLSELPSEEETDSREGMDTEEEFLDLEGCRGTGMVKDCSLGEELRGDGAAPIQQVQGWDRKKDL